MKLKLYVWTGVLTDYTSGLAFAIAKDEGEAKRMIEEKLGYALEYTKENLHVHELKEPIAYYVHGGS